eukprot:CAMPEP_0170554544 /NCGR_PEP_ID=MMETSP0211-20121228/12402_1 /TAXON_ID=311385 /ORGANISM="Pseudokeronopsis sp., Strain OXSARD2" /LENGTH=63 /DNA_ID=CAMNT_0010863687 /DNA_START=242 /DNA_END=433 /DNA_ORIENTATION=-
MNVPGYSNSLMKQTQQLNVYNQMIAEKNNQKSDLKAMIEYLKSEIKKTLLMSKDHRKRQEKLD